jgi:hypothetical protein
MNTNMSNNNNDDDDDALLLVSLEEELNNLRHKRQRYQQEIQYYHFPLINEWQFRLAALQQQQYTQTTMTASSNIAKKTADKGSFEYCNHQSWHVLGDVFLIWHRGPFATINGFRLGRCAITTVGRADKYATTATTAEANANASTSRSSTFAIMAVGNTTTNTSTTTDTATTTTTNSSTVTTPTILIEQPKKIIVPWNEINSALGQVVFLLYTLQYNTTTPNSRRRIKFTCHVLQPCGGTSKIGVLKNKQQQQQQQTGSSSNNYNNERRRITALAAYNTNSSNSNNNSNNSMLGNNTTISTLSSSSSSSNNNNTSIPSPRLSLVYELASNNDGIILPNNATVGGAVTWYNLYHYEENGSLLSMGYYARRNFNVALESLLYCIIEACSCAMEVDVQFTIPYDMSCNGLSITGCAGGGSSSNNSRPTMVMTMSTRIGSKTSNVATHKASNINNSNNAAVSNNSGGKGGGTGGGGGGPMVNGLSLSYDPTNGEQWTMVCKYLLTNVKWLITYAAKHC